MTLIAIDMKCQQRWQTAAPLQHVRLHPSELVPLQQRPARLAAHLDPDQLRLRRVGGRLEHAVPNDHVVGGVEDLQACVRLLRAVVAHDRPLNDVAVRREELVVRLRPAAEDAHLGVPLHHAVHLLIKSNNNRRQRRRWS